MDRIKELCKAKGKTLASLEKECGLGNGTISKWDKVSPSIDKVILISRALEVTVGEILGEKNPAPNNEDGINAKEKAMLELYRLLPNDVQEDIYYQIEAALKRRGLLQTQSK